MEERSEIDLKKRDNWNPHIHRHTQKVMRGTPLLHYVKLYVWMWEVDNKKGWVPKNWCLWTVVLEKTLKSPLDCKIKPVNLKRDQSRIFTGRTDAEAEAPVFWSPDVNSQLIGKGSDAGKDWGQKEKRVSEERWLDDSTDAMIMNLGKLQETVRYRKA